MMSTMTDHSSLSACGAPGNKPGNNKEVGGTAELKSESIDQTANTHNLLTLEALHIWRERPKINTRDEFRSRELTLKLYSMFNMAKI